MSPPVLNRSWSRQIDRRAIDDYGMSGLVLMENAGRGVVDRLVELKIGGPVVICCGRGNNAGDGFVIARHLDIRRHKATVLVWGDPAELPPDARANFDILKRCEVRIEAFGPKFDARRLARELAGADWIVDALLGTGARGDPRPPLDAVIDGLNDASARKLAIDIPSGLDCDTGETSPHTFRADYTCTFVTAKPGFYVPRAADFTGQIHVVDIGVPRTLVDEVLAEAEISKTPSD